MKLEDFKKLHDRTISTYAKNGVVYVREEHLNNGFTLVVDAINNQISGITKKSGNTTLHFDKDKKLKFLERSYNSIGDNVTNFALGNVLAFTLTIALAGATGKITNSLSLGTALLIAKTSIKTGTLIGIAKSIFTKAKSELYKEENFDNMLLKLSDNEKNKIAKIQGDIKDMDFQISTCF